MADQSTVILGVMGIAATLISPFLQPLVPWVSNKLKGLRSTSNPDQDQTDGQPTKKTQWWAKALSPFVTSPLAIAYDIWWLSRLIRFGNHQSNLTVLDISLAVGSIFFCVGSMALTTVDNKLRKLSALSSALVAAHKKSTELHSAALQTDLDNRKLIEMLAETQGSPVPVIENANTPANTPKTKKAAHTNQRGQPRSKR